MTDTLLLIGLYAAFTAIGWVLLGGIGIRFAPGWRAAKCGLAPLVGTLGTSAVAVALATLGIQMRVLLVLAVAAGLAVAVRRLGVRRGVEPWELRASPVGLGWLAVEAVIVVIGLVVAVATIRLFVVSPLDLWDGWAIWGVHAHALHVEGVTSSPVFTASAYRGSHPEYPVLYPALEALVTRTTGDFEPASILLGPGLILVSAAAAAWGVLRTVVNPVVAAATGLALLGSQFLVDNFRSNYADGALATVTAIGVLLLAVWLRSESTAALVLGTGLLAAACLIKTEGLGFAVAAFLAAAVAGAGRGNRLRPLAPALLLALAPAIASQLIARARGARQDTYHLAGIVQPGYLSDNWDRATRSAERLFTEMADAWGPMLALLVIVGVLAIAAARPWPAVFLGLWLALSFGWLILVYLLSTAPIEWHLLTSAARVVFTPAVGILLIAPLLATDAWDGLGLSLALRSTRLRSGHERPPV